MTRPRCSHHLFWVGTGTRGTLEPVETGKTGVKGVDTPVLIVEMGREPGARGVGPVQSVSVPLSTVESRDPTETQTVTIAGGASSPRPSRSVRPPVSSPTRTGVPYVRSSVYGSPAQGHGGRGRRYRSGGSRLVWSGSRVRTSGGRPVRRATDVSVVLLTTRSPVPNYTAAYLGPPAQMPSPPSRVRSKIFPLFIFPVFPVLIYSRRNSRQPLVGPTSYPQTNTDSTKGRRGKRRSTGVPPVSRGLRSVLLPETAPDTRTFVWWILGEGFGQENLL